MTDRARVTGIGGVFFKSRDPVALAAWYREQLGVELGAGATYAKFTAGPDGRDAAGARVKTAWSVFPAESEYFGTGPAGWMINYRVANLDAMVEQLRAAGGWVSDGIESGPFGRFAWAADPEGTRFELWEPVPEPPTGDAASKSGAA